MIEQWNQIPNFSRYKISSFGNIFDIKRNIQYNFSNTKEDNYISVSLVNDNNIRCSFSVHKLVAVAFIENPLQLTIVNHIDGNKKNNNVSNLEWCTSSYNTKHWHKLEGERLKKLKDNMKIKLENLVK